MLSTASPLSLFTIGLLTNLCVAHPAPQNPPTPFKCTPEITDATRNPKDRWAAADANDEWLGALNYVKAAANPAKLSFPELVSNFVDGPPNMHCGIIAGRDGCATESKCVDAASGGFLILNSFVGISDVSSCLPSAGKANLTLAWCDSSLITSSMLFITLSRRSLPRLPTLPPPLWLSKIRIRL